MIARDCRNGRESKLKPQQVALARQLYDGKQHTVQQLAWALDRAPVTQLVATGTTRRQTRPYGHSQLEWCFSRFRCTMLQGVTQS